MTDGPLSIEQIAQIIRGACHISPTNSVEEEEAERLVKWCSDVLIDHATVTLVLRGDVGMSWHPDEPDPMFHHIRRPYDEESRR